MKTITLQVIVTGGVLPVPIKIFIDGGTYHYKEEQDGSFSKDYHLPLGDYSVRLGGRNHPGITKIQATIGGELQGEPIPSWQQNSAGSEYSLTFFITV